MIRLMLVMLSKWYCKINKKESISKVISVLEKDIEIWNKTYAVLPKCDHCGSIKLKPIIVYIDDTGDQAYECEDCHNKQQGEDSNLKNLDKELLKLGITKERVLGKNVYRYKLPSELVITRILIGLKVLLVCSVIGIIVKIIIN